MPALLITPPLQFQRRKSTLFVLQIYNIVFFKQSF